MVQKYLSATDFDNILNAYGGRQISLTKTSRTISNISGEEEITELTPTTIKAHFMRTMQGWDYSKAGFLEQGDAVALTKIADNVLINDLITVDGEVFRVKEAFKVPGIFDANGSGTTYIYTSCNLFLAK